MEPKEVLAWIRKAKLEKWDGLDLSRNRISTLPPELGEIESLTVLDISHRGPLEVSPEIGQLENLTFLDVSQTGIFNTDRSPSSFKRGSRSTTKANRSDVPAQAVN